LNNRNSFNIIWSFKPNNSHLVIFYQNYSVLWLLIMKSHYLVLLLFFLHTSITALGQCSITAPSKACVGEVVELKASSTLSIDSVIWDLGDQSSAKQVKFNHIYTTSGNLTIRLKVYLSTGDSCETTKSIRVYEGPQLKVSLDPTSSYCFSSNRICINDSTKKGNSNGKITKRTVLWGDGNRTLSTNPSFPSDVCHNYSKNGKFSITVQTENEHGCTSEQTFSIEIKKDFPINFIDIYIGESCVDETHLFINDSLSTNSDIDSFVWSWGDGEFERSRFDSNFHTYKAKQNYVVGLKVFSKNGCINEMTKNVVIDFPEIRFLTTKSDDTICAKNTIVLEADKRYGDTWTWAIVNKQFRQSYELDGSVTYFTAQLPGTHIISLKIEHGSCQRHKTIDSFEVVGIASDIELLNASQCGNNDTVFACNLSKVYGTNDYTYIWDFGDSLSSKCTTDVANNANIDSNCNFTEGQHAKHFYNDTICGQVKLYAIDHQNGCIDSTDRPVTLLLTGKDQFKYKAKRKCVGGSGDNAINFFRQECLRGIRVNYDSACNKDNFVSFIDFYNYQSTCDSSGKVTVGFAIQNGDGKIYASCDTTDYIISNRNTCIDTLWFHDWFSLQKPPLPAFYRDTSKLCVPAELGFTLHKPRQKNVAKMTWIWGDGHSETVLVPKDYDSLPTKSHYYTTENQYSLELKMETDSGCTENNILNINLGYFNDFYLPEDTCIEDSFELYDSLHYWGSDHRFWRDTTYDLVGLSWDFDDGRGFATKGPLPKMAYPKPGKYTIRMASFDEFGCFDTASHEIEITCVEAGIKELTQKLLCGGIVRFRNSSSTKLGIGRITSHFWDFGDGTTPNYVQNPFHYYRKFGTFTVTHIVGTENNCFDTAYYQMQVDGPESNFRIASDSIGCVPLKVEFENLSHNASRYIWQFGDSANLKWTTFSDTNVFHTYQQPGTYYIRLIALDSVFDDLNNEYIFCEAEFPDSIIHPNVYRKVIVLPRPAVDFKLPEIICKNQIFTLTDASDSIYSQFIWNISNGATVNSSNPSNPYTFSDTGTYTILYTPKYQVVPPLVTCLDSISKTVRVKGIEALFDYEQKPNCPIFTFTNRSEPTDSTLWNLGDPEAEDNESKSNTITHDYKAHDSEYKVCLTVWKDGCIDTFCEVLSSVSTFDLFIPNVFTPDGDDYNNEFEIRIEGESTYELSIFNRWGELIYLSEEDSELGDGKNWNGIDQKNGNLLPEGVYFYLFKYKLDCGGESGQSQGTITLIR
jgi:gliding motility-associated-like protein